MECVTEMLEVDDIDGRYKNRPLIRAAGLCFPFGGSAR